MSMADFLDTGKEEETGSSLYAETVYEFVENFVRIHYETPILDNTSGTTRWCSEWANHPQAMLIFEGLWRSYEEARAADMVNAGGQSTMNYLVGHFYPMMDRISGSYGPFKRCHPTNCAGAVKLGEVIDPERMIQF